MFDLKKQEQFMSQMKELIGCSLRIDLPMQFWSRDNVTLVIDKEDSWYNFYANIFNVSRDIIFFVYEGTMYAIPFTNVVLHFLQGNKFRKDITLSIPLSVEGLVPISKDIVERWNYIVANIRPLRLKELQTQLQKDCLVFSDRVEILELPDNLLKSCLLIPNGGIKLNTPFLQGNFRPVVSQHLFSFEVAKVLGTYAFCGDAIVFVYRDGHTFISPQNDTVIKCLNDAGFTENPGLCISK